MSEDPGSRSCNVAVSRAGGAWDSGLPEAGALAARAVRAALDAVRNPDLQAAPVEVSVLLADDATLQQLNRDYRQRDRATNVLAFPNMAPDEAPPPGLGLALGDLALAWETLSREAAAQDKPLAHHFCHLLVHGTLHLLGYDHETTAEAELMEAAERRILGSLGIPDPYRSPGDGAPPSKEEALGAD